jgi:hypothetical protein
MKYIYYALIFAGLLILLIRWNKVDKRLHLFAPLLTLAILTELIGDWQRIYYVTHVYQFIEFALLTTYYFLILAGSRLQRWVWLGLVAYLLYFGAFFIRFPNHFTLYDPVDFVAEGVFITGFSLYYLVELYRRDERVRLSHHPHFWIASVNLVFYSGTAFFMGMAYTLWKKNAFLYDQLGLIVKLLNLTLYIVYIKAFLCRLPERSLD